MDILKEDIGITHVVSAILGIEKIAPKDFDYHIVHIRDVEWVDIYKYLSDTSDYITNALKSSPDAKVLIHCKCGVSRSATLLCAYLIKEHNMTTTQAINFLKKHPEVVWLT